MCVIPLYQRVSIIRCLFAFMIHALKSKVLSSCRPISLIYGSEDRENLGPLIKLKCAQQQVWPNHVILVVFSLDYVEQKSGQSLQKFRMKSFDTNLCNHCAKTFVSSYCLMSHVRCPHIDISVKCKHCQKQFNVVMSCMATNKSNLRIQKAEFLELIHTL